VSEPSPEAPPPGRVPPWRNPFVVAFVVGAVFLTVLPFMQRRFLKAPPPGPSLGAWQLQLTDGGTFGAEQLKGKVWIASFADEPARQAEFGSILRHVDDLGGKVVLVSFVAPGATGPEGNDRWFVVTGSSEKFQSLAMGQFQPAFIEALTSRYAGGFSRDFDAGSTLAEWTRIPTIAVVDQNGALRAFWSEKDLGQGNAINAARFLAKQDPKP